MRAFAALLLAAFAGVMLTQSVAQGGQTAKKTATIAIPSDGNMAVAHLVLKATPKKGKKPKKPAKLPKLKVKKAPKGVAVVAASYKRDAKNKNRFHATVALTNPFTKKTFRAASSASDPGDDGAILLTVIETDDAYIIVIEEVQIEQDVTFAEMPVPLWIGPYCDPPGSGGDIFLLGPPPGGVSASEYLDYGCVLGLDGPADFDVYDELDLAGLFFDLDVYPGTPNEYYLRFEGVNIDPFRGAAFQFPGHTVTAQLPPAGFGGVITPNTITWGNKNQPFVPGQVYRGNVRFNTPLDEDEIYRGLYTPTGSNPYSDPFPGHFTP